MFEVTEGSPCEGSHRGVALALGTNGFRVLPLVEGKKRAAIKDWPNKATADLEQIRRWWTCSVTEWEQPYGVGIACGHGLAVLDIDDRDDKSGSETLAELEREHGALPATMTVRTPSGGRHLYFAVEQDVDNSQGALGPGLDVRGQGGYVVAPGTEMPTGIYVLEAGSPSTIVPCPPWLRARMGAAPAPREPGKATAPPVALDGPAAVERAERYLIDDAPEAIEGQSGDLTTFKVAARVKDYGISEPACLELMQEHYQRKCFPPWEPGELAKKVASAYRNGRNAPGSASPEADFDPVPDVPGAGKATALGKKKRRLRLEALADISLPGKRPELVADLLDHGALSVVYGDSNTGKSFFALDLAFSVARGVPWRGHATERRGVVYVAAEGAGSIKMRAKAYEKHHGVEAATTPFWIMPDSVNLFDPAADTSELIACVRDAGEQSGAPIGLIVVDTLARVMAGGDENSGRDMGALVRNLDKIRADTGANVMLIHHSGKDKARGARGHSSLRAAVDTELEVTSNPKDRDAPRVATVLKQRDRETGQRFAFRLARAEVSRDDGTPGGTCILEPVDLAAVRDFDQPEPKGRDKIALDALRAVVERAGVTGGSSADDVISAPPPCATRDDWRAEFCLHPEIAGIKKPDTRLKAFNTAVDRLTSRGLVLWNGHGFALA